MYINPLRRTEKFYNPPRWLVLRMVPFVPVSLAATVHSAAINLLNNCFDDILTTAPSLRKGTRSFRGTPE